MQSNFDKNPKSSCVYSAQGHLVCDGDESNEPIIHTTNSKNKDETFAEGFQSAFTGDFLLPNGVNIRAPGRMHISGDELLYVLNKNGLVIGKEWGGSGDLNIQGRLCVGPTCVNAEQFALMMGAANRRPP